MNDVMIERWRGGCGYLVVKNWAHQELIVNESQLRPIPGGKTSIGPGDIAELIEPEYKEDHQK